MLRSLLGRKERQSRLRVSSETGSLQAVEVSRRHELVARESPVSKDANPEAEKSTTLGAVTRQEPIRR